MLDDPWFWPDGIVCKPWLSRNTMNYRDRRVHTRKDNKSFGSKWSHIDNNYGIEDTNRFSVLTSDID